MSAADTVGFPTALVGRTVRRQARAKVNLALRVLGKRPDGYHLIDSHVGFTQLGDTIEVAPSTDLTLDIDGPFAAALRDEPDNLVLRAARALADAAGRRPQAAIRLTKRLPVASGIGGGSADAAATLLALAELWALPTEPGDLEAIGLALGADVPMCLQGRFGIASGIGERVIAHDQWGPFDAVPILLANPGVPVATRDVFAAREGPFNKRPLNMEDIESPADVVRLARMGNDLTVPALSLCPVIGDVLEALRDLAGARVAAMSGSGATCFALFGTIEGAEAAARDLAADHPGWWIAATALDLLPGPR